MKNQTILEKFEKDNKIPIKYFQQNRQILKNKLKIIKMPKIKKIEKKL